MNKRLPSHNFTSQLTTTLYANNLIDEGIAVEALEKKVIKLTRLIEEKNPVCPHCKTKMAAAHFNGYYESFYMWECSCLVIPNAEKQSGAFT